MHIGFAVCSVGVRSIQFAIYSLHSSFNNQEQKMAHNRQLLSAQLTLYKMSNWPHLDSRYCNMLADLYSKLQLVIAQLESKNKMRFEEIHDFYTQKEFIAVRDYCVLRLKSLKEDCEAVFDDDKEKIGKLIDSLTQFQRAATASMHGDYLIAKATPKALKVLGIEVGDQKTGGLHAANANPTVQKTWGITGQRFKRFSLSTMAFFNRALTLVQRSNSAAKPDAKATAAGFKKPNG